MRRKSIAILFVISFTPTVISLEIDLKGFNPEHEFGAELKDNKLHFSWKSNPHQFFAVFQLDQKGKETESMPLIESIGIDKKTVINNLLPHYLFWIGDRTLDKRGWTIFFDRVNRRPFTNELAILEPSKIKVSTSKNRAKIKVDSLKSKNFEGSLNFHFYHGSAFIHMEAQVSTERPKTAFLYDVALEKVSPKNNTLHWIDPLGAAQSLTINETAKAKPLATRFRSVSLGSNEGSITLSPFPHQYLYPLDFADNFNYNWFGTGYQEKIKGFCIGTRQPPQGDKRYVPWVNAPPKTVQKLGTLIHISKQSGLDNINRVKKYTRDDSFKALPGYKTFTSHYHVEHSLDYIKKQKEEKTQRIPSKLVKPEFVDVFKEMGIDIVHLAEFHVGKTPRLKTKERLAELKVMHDECERLSTDKFLLLPGEEPNVHLGGHWISFFPKPINWVLNRKEGQPFEQEIEGIGKVYSVGSSEDIIKLFEKEKGLLWTAHPRLKSSFGYPDRYKETDFYKNDIFLGAAWKAMPADYSRETLGWRVLDLQDDMANWGQKKYIVGEVDIFKIFKGYELFGTMNVNYIKLDKLPKYQDGWQPVLDALRNGSFFVTTGEILIPQCSFSGKESGETLPSIDLRHILLDTDLEWTYPLAFMEIVSGDGKKVYRQRIDLNDTQEFQSRKIQKSIDLRGRHWVRIEVWDIAKNGAFTVPVWIQR